MNVSKLRQTAGVTLLLGVVLILLVGAVVGFLTRSTTTTGYLLGGMSTGEGLQTVVYQVRRTIYIDSFGQEVFRVEESVLLHGKEVESEK
jgi:hypothetical protein